MKIVKLEDLKDYSEIYWWKPEEQAQVMALAKAALTAEDMAALTEVDGWEPVEVALAEMEEAQKQYDHL